MTTLDVGEEKLLGESGMSFSGSNGRVTHAQCGYHRVTSEASRSALMDFLFPVVGLH